MGAKRDSVVIVCGGRDYSDVPALFRVMDELDAKHNIILLVEGASDDVTGPYKGADYWARQWAFARKKERVTERAHWKTEGRAAGPIRNQRMLDRYIPDMVIAFPGGCGTDSMKGLARKAKVKVVNAFPWMVD